MEDAYKLYEDLRSETEYLRKKQQRKGVEYKMRESPGGKAERGSNLLTRALQRPSDLAGTATSPRKNKDEVSLRMQASRQRTWKQRGGKRGTRGALGPLLSVSAPDLLPPD